MKTILLNKAETLELIAKAKAGCNKSRNKLIKHNYGLAFKAIKQYEYPGIAEDDLVQVALIGLNRAIDKFNPAKGAFSTIAFVYMKSELTKALPTLARGIRVPIQHYWTYSHIRRLLAKHGKLTVKQLADLLVANGKLPDNGKQERMVRNVLEEFGRTYLSLNYTYDGDSRELEEMLDVGNQHYGNSIEQLSKQELMAYCLRTLQEELSEFELAIISRRYGLFGNKQVTMEAIAKDCPTHNKRQLFNICDNAKKRIRHKLKHLSLQDVV